MTALRMARRALAGAQVMFGGRREGNASIELGVGGHEGRRAVLAALGLSPADAVFMEQVHGKAVGRVGRADRGRRVAGVDALVTTEDDVALVVLTADCVPILLLDPGRGAGAVHAGRRGVAAGIVPAAVAALTEATGSPPSRLTALTGPAIGGCCYEVPATLAEEVAGVVPAARAETSWGTPSLDLPAAVEAALDACGVGKITRAPECTHCTGARWFSHRAVAQGAPEGRNASVIVRSTRMRGSPM